MFLYDIPGRSVTDIIIVEVNLLNADLERLADCHDRVSSIVVIPEFEDAVLPEILLAAKLHLAEDGVRTVAVLLVGRDVSLVGGFGIVLVFANGYPVAHGSDTGNLAGAVFAHLVQSDPVLARVVGGGSPSNVNRLSVRNSEGLGALLRRSVVNLERVISGIVGDRGAIPIGQQLDSEPCGSESSLSVLHDAHDSLRETGSRSLEQLLDELGSIGNDFVDTTLEHADLVGNGRGHGLADGLGDPGFMADLASVQLPHVRPFDQVKEQKRADMRKQPEQEDGRRRGYQNDTPDTGTTDETLGIVEVSVNSRVRQVRARKVEEEVAVEPPKLAERFVDRERGPRLKCDQHDSDSVSEECHALVGRGKLVQLPGGGHKRSVRHGKRHEVNTLPLPPSVLASLAELQEVTNIALVPALTDEYSSDSDSVPESPKHGVDDKQSLVARSARRQKREHAKVEDEKHAGEMDAVPRIQGLNKRALGGSLAKVGEDRSSR